jgi:hypothetical protein
MSGRGPGVALALARTADGRPILARADLERYDPHFTRSGGRERFYCPVHGSDQQRSLTVDPRTGHYHCHTCKASGTLRDYWPDRVPKASRPAAVPPSLEEIGRRALENRARIQAARAERLAGALPREAAAFLVRCDAMNRALREPDCPGAAYLRRRGLDPALAAALGAGYAAPNAWPGDRGRTVGRIVYPLADPTTGHLMSALGRLCADPDDTWSDAVRAAFKAAKQRKLAGCPAGVWPYASVATALENRRPLVLVEGPADALAVLRATTQPLAVVALVGTANVVPATLLRALPGVVAALDADGSGARAVRALRTECAIAGVPVDVLPPDWLGEEGAKDPGDLAARAAAEAPGNAAAAARRAYARAGAAVELACARLCGAPWEDDRAMTLLVGLYDHCARLCRDLPAPYPAFPEDAERAIDATFAARDWAALVAAVEACERGFQALITHGSALIGDDDRQCGVLESAHPLRP